MRTKVFKLLAVLLVVSLMLAGCASPVTQEILDEVALAEHEISENSLEATIELSKAIVTTTATESIKESVEKELENPDSILESIDSTEVVEKENTTKVDNTKQNSEVISSSGSIIDRDLSNMTVDNYWDYLTPEEQAALLPVQQEIENLLIAAGGGSSNNSSRSSSNNNSTGSTAAQSGSATRTDNSRSNENTNKTDVANNNENVSTGTPAIPENTQTPATSEPAQHSHNYAWVESGDSRILTCSCGETTGITEYRYGSVWGYYDDGAASTLFDFINNQRNSGTYTVQEQGFTIAVENVPSLNLSGDLTSKAKSRAIEAATNFSHGENHDECLAWGQGSAQETFEAWCYSQSHARAMTDPEYVSGGTACFWFDSDNSGTNLTPIWVLELSR